MLKIAVIVWMILGTALAGTIVTAILTVPSLANGEMKLIPAGAVAGFVLAIPFAVVLARRMMQSMKLR